MLKGRGISFPMLLGLLFVGCKLTGHIDWSWWWVTAPFWLPLAIILLFCSFCICMAGLVELVEYLRKSK